MCGAAVSSTQQVDTRQVDTHLVHQVGTGGHPPVPPLDTRD